MAQSEYEQAQELASTQGNSPIANGCGKCHEDGNWIHVRYEYPDASPVTDAVYVVQNTNNYDDLVSKIVFELRILITHSL